MQRDDQEPQHHKKRTTASRIFKKVFYLCPIEKGLKEARDVMLIRNTFYRGRNSGRKTERGR
jgi:hypothetical protein